MTPDTRPNIIVVLCDDLGFGDVGVLFQNQLRRTDPTAPSLRTPRIDQMAEEGLTLTGMYCSAPVCAPSRASLLTGTTQGHADLRDNAFDRALEDSENMATVLRSRGYATAAIGKWGLQGTADPGGELPGAWPAYPTRRGFDEFYGYVRHADGHEHYPKEGLHRGRKEVWHNDTEVSDGLDGCYTTDLFTARAKQWITEQCVDTGERQPFFCYLAYDTPHAVTELPPCAYPDGAGANGGVQWIGDAGNMINTAGGEPDSYRHPDSVAPPGCEPWPDVYQRYATVVRRIDDCVGDLLTLLGDLGIDEETLVIFTSDNGPSIESYLTEPYRADFFSSYGPFDGIKRDCWEGGVRVGALVRAPGLVDAGRSSAAPVQFHDLLPTFAELAGATPPARTDGVSLVPLLTGRGEQRPSTVYTEYAVKGATPDYEAFHPSRRGRLRGQMQLIRLGDHVGVRYDVRSADDPFEIYDVLADPKQEHDLRDRMPELHHQMLSAVPRMRMPHADAPRPYDDELATPVGGATSGAPGPVERRTYTDSHPWVPLLDTVEPTTSTTVDWPVDDQPVPPGTTAMFYTGELFVEADGAHRFEVTGPGAVVLRIHDALVAEGPSPAAPSAATVPVTGTMRLARGVHPFRLYVTGAEPPRVSWARVE
ncbi:MAG TPA: sulfatase-like hydrolase/transferase [Bacillota bacterium]|nr:sulfatase-like hydrolase/transferase [Bacillota bacterium]